eukprot:CAMPEP_0118979420 /NCGR_PEP_ID=MMETSP1173-20130426/25898_1 /TAXON_ID=1034831 /ORGANISM="Rhizochromulina marina cf, Strain CCMP1243" /LENGTH=153 /DNA_ID=CAMNT_0006929679 /DNA_START=562 /DNA_END=1023 /DNA_ORIENTATION=+
MALFLLGGLPRWGQLSVVPAASGGRGTRAIQGRWLHCAAPCGRLATAAPRDLIRGGGCHAAPLSASRGCTGRNFRGSASRSIESDARGIFSRGNTIDSATSGTTSWSRRSSKSSGKRKGRRSSSGGGVAHRRDGRLSGFKSSAGPPILVVDEF